MNSASRSLWLLGLALLVSAKIPGPCTFDAHEELECGETGVCPDGLTCGADGYCKEPVGSGGGDGSGGTGTDPDCELNPDDCGFLDNSCTTDADCAGFTINGDEQAICRGDGLCDVKAFCPPQQANIHEFCRANEDCVLDPNAEFFGDGVCVRRSASPLPVGATCPLALAETNPCETGTFCWPTSPTEGVCLASCEDGQACGAGTRCGRPYNTFTVPLFGRACLPTCDGDASNCPAGFDACLASRDEPSCLDDVTVCQVAGCDGEGCFAECDASACAAGTFCIAEEIFDSCGRVARSQSCHPPGDLGDPCVLDAINSCGAGGACIPIDAGAQCVTQDSTPLADGSACEAVQGGNPCAKGSWCTATGGQSGVCIRSCSSSGDCDVGDECVRGNLYALPDARVCAAPCDPSLPSCLVGLSCDVDNDESCASGPGSCLPPEVGDSCGSDLDCTDRAGDVCVIDQCLPPADRCL